MIDQLQNFLKSTGFKVVDTNLTNTIVAIQTDTKLIISVTNKKCIIAKEVDTDIRFKGEIQNIQQLKMILTCINKYGI